MSLNYFFSTGVRGLSEGKQENQFFFFTSFFPKIKHSLHMTKEEENK
jgi:hypothetical protein